MTQPLYSDTIAAILAQLNVEVTQLETGLISGISSAAGLPAFDHTGLVPSNQHMVGFASSTNQTYNYASAWTDAGFARTQGFTLLTAEGSPATTPFLILGEIDAQLMAGPNQSTGLQGAIDVRMVLEDSTLTVVQATGLQTVLGYGLTFGTGPQANFTFFMFADITASQDTGATLQFLDGQNFTTGTFYATFQYQFEPTYASGHFQTNESNIDVFRLG